MIGENNKKILLVEDEIIIAMLVKQQLENYGYTVHHVSNGEDARIHERYPHARPRSISDNGSHWF